MADADDAVADADAPRRPRSTAELFRVFNRLALQGFGGVLPIAQRELVEREGWMTRDQFLSTLALAQVLPGPNVVNLALIAGDRWFGWRGAAAALAGMLAAPLAIVIVLAAVASRAGDVPWVAGALRGMGVAAAGLVLATAVRLAGGLRRSALGTPLAAAVAAAAFFAVGLVRWPLVAVVAVLGTAAVAVAHRRLRR